MAEAEGPLRLRDWLVAQIESGGYAGSRWEDAGMTVFRIRWKHAAKQGYQARQDAVIFRAWAIYKGKCLEGIDKQNLSTWKTRLRCALNKSADFCEGPGHRTLHTPGAPCPSSSSVTLIAGCTCGCSTASSWWAKPLRARPRAAICARLRGAPAGAATACRAGSLPEPLPGAHLLQRLLPHLERSVLLWVAPEGVLAKSLCQGPAPRAAQPSGT